MRYPVKREFISTIYKNRRTGYGKKSDFYKNWYKIQKNDQGTSGREQSRRTDW